MHYSRCLAVAAAAVAFAFPSLGAAAVATLTAPFAGEADVGQPPLAGSVEYDAARRQFTVAGGGANMWFSNDSFHFVWTKVSGDASLAADIAFPGAGGDPHRK